MTRPTCRSASGISAFKNKSGQTGSSRRAISETTPCICGPRSSCNPPVFLGLGPCTLNGVQYPTCSTTANTDQRRRLRLENPAVRTVVSVTVIQIDSGGTASYNGLLLSVQRRAARGVTVSGNYTWSHCISDSWQETAQSPNARFRLDVIRTTGGSTAAIAARRQRTGGIFSICRPWPKHRSFPTRRCALWDRVGAFRPSSNSFGRLSVRDHQSGQCV